MHWRLTRAAYEREKGAGNRAAFQALVAAGPPPGLLAYAGSAPVPGQALPAGWCALGPREQFPTLDRSRVLRRIDDTPVWSVVCFFVARQWRGQGVAARLLAAALKHAEALGAAVVEGYPVEPRQPHMPDVFAFTGTAALFRAAGFNEVARRSATRPIMRYALPGAPAGALVPATGAATTPAVHGKDGRL
jgi:GNAT superfamily N-acetyltransferase